METEIGSERVDKQDVQQINTVSQHPMLQSLTTSITLIISLYLWIANIHFQERI